MEPNALFSKDTPVLNIKDFQDDTGYMLVDLDAVPGLQKYDLVRVIRGDESTFFRGLVYDVYDDCVCVQVERGNTYWL